MLCEFCRLTRAGAIWMGISIGLVFVVVGAKADEILLNQELQEGFVVALLAAGNAYFFAINPIIGDRARNCHGDDAVSEVSAKSRIVGDLKPVYKVVLTRCSKPDSLLDRAGPAEGLDLRPAEAEANGITKDPEFHGLLTCQKSPGNISGTGSRGI